MKLCWIVVLVGISIILVFLYSLVAMSSRSERFIEQLMEEEGRTRMPTPKPLPMQNAAPVWGRIAAKASIPMVRSN